MLDSLRILVPESRELDLFATLLEAEAATVIRCPLVQILDPDDHSAVEAWIDRCIAGEFDDVILLTGEGLRRLLGLAGSRRDAFVTALAKPRKITRGPKPVRALREIRLAPDLLAKVPTSEGVLAALEPEPIKGHKIGVQLYPGDGGLPLVRVLIARGAETFPVTPYRYASDSETKKVEETIHKLDDGKVDLIAFTSSPQIEHLVRVARETGLDEELKRGLSRTPIASIGPVVDSTLETYGFTSAVRPESNFHLKPLVRAIVAWNTGRQNTA